MIIIGMIVVKIDRGPDPPDPPRIEKTVVECPHCGRKVVIEHSRWLEYCSIECPHCRKVFYVDLYVKKAYTRDIYLDPL